MDSEQSTWDDDEDDEENENEEQAPADLGTKFCTNCGNAREGSAKFCTNCGTAIN
jgi:membrane protease subunit (stomatin/prohibitin family)